MLSLPLEKFWFLPSPVLLLFSCCRLKRVLSSMEVSGSDQSSGGDYLQQSHTGFGLAKPHDWSSLGFSTLPLEKFCFCPCSCYSPAVGSKQFLARWTTHHQIRAQVRITYCKATLTSAWQDLMTDAQLGFQLCPWKSFAFAPALATLLLLGPNSS